MVYFFVGCFSCEESTFVVVVLPANSLLGGFFSFSPVNVCVCVCVCVCVMCVCGVVVVVCVCVMCVVMVVMCVWCVCVCVMCVCGVRVWCGGDGGGVCVCERVCVGGCG